jgi:hypothetical protein
MGFLAHGKAMQKNLPVRQSAAAARTWITFRVVTEEVPANFDVHQWWPI